MAQDWQQSAPDNWSKLMTMPTPQQATHRDYYDGSILECKINLGCQYQIKNGLIWLI